MMEVTKSIVWEALKPVKDPEIDLGIVELGLIYDVDIEDEGKKVIISMTLTTPMCPYGPFLVQEVENAVKSIPGVENAEIRIVWEPQWNPNTMATDEVKDKMGIW